MVLFWRPILLFCLAGTGQSGLVTLDYIEGQQRLNEGSELDFYFCCKVKGQSMQWVINGTGYKTFYPRQQLPTVARGSLDHLPNSNYTATLLSSRTTADGDHYLDSILIVSVEGNITIDVGCVSDSGRDFSSNREMQAQSSDNMKQAQSPDNMIKLVQLWNHNVIQGGTTITTKFLMCVVYSSSLIWETSNNETLTFNTGHSLGSESSLVSADNNSVWLQAIYFAQSLKQLVSITLVTSHDSISCKDGNSSVSTDQLQSITTEPTHSNGIDVYQTSKEKHRSGGLSSHGKVKLSSWFLFMIMIILALNDLMHSLLLIHHYLLIVGNFMFCFL